MSTRKCGHLAPCGCDDPALTTPAPCPDPGPCPTPYPCSETTDAQCVLYTGDDILCDNTSIVAQGMSVAEGMQAIVDYFCNATGAIANDILCNNDVVISAGTNFADAMAEVVNYFCNAMGTPNVVLQEGANINITSNTVDGITTYTISADPVCPMTVKIEGTTLVPRSIQATVTGGVAPYTYDWETADFSGDVGALNSMIELSSTAYPQVVQPGFNGAHFGNRFDSNGVINSARIGLAKVTVTDANGCIARDTLLVIFTPQIIG